MHNFSETDQREHYHENHDSFLLLIRAVSISVTNGCEGRSDELNSVDVYRSVFRILNAYFIEPAVSVPETKPDPKAGQYMYHKRQVKQCMQDKRAIESLFTQLEAALGRA